METRMLGSSGICAGVVGLGCEGLLGKPVTFYHKALDMMESKGANCLDLYSPNPEMRTNLGQALAGRRDKFVLQGHFCSCWQDGQYKCIRDLETTKYAFDDLLQRLGTDYIDIGMIHYVDSEAGWQKVKQGGILDYALKLRKNGVIRCLGISSHNPLIALTAIREAPIEVLMFSVNPCYDLQPAGEDVEQLWNRERYKGLLNNMDPDREKLYETCMEKGVGITVMKAFGGGDLLDAEKSLAGMALSVHQAIRYALDRPGVACVLAGAHSLAELAQCLEYEPGKHDSYAEVLAGFPRISWKGHCMYCGHCAPCPARIDVAALTRLLNLVRAQGYMPETVREHYNMLSHKAGECTGCGICETRCPFDVRVRENMKAAADIFGG